MENEEMNKDRIIEYMLANEKARYEDVKAVTGTIKHILITLIIAVAVCVCFYMYYVVPVETEEVIVDGNSKAAIHNNGSEIWQ
jgi:hypothetical protein